MNSADFNTARAALGFDLAQTAVWLGINPSTAWRYANGSSPIPGPVARALRTELALKVHEGAVMELRHALERGPTWYTNGRAGMWAQVTMWINKAAQSRADLAPLLAMEGGE